jgi:hypothetical protein
MVDLRLITNDGFTVNRSNSRMAAESSLHGRSTLGADRQNYHVSAPNTDGGVLTGPNGTEETTRRKHSALFERLMGLLTILGSMGSICATIYVLSFFN